MNNIKSLPGNLTARSLHTRANLTALVWKCCLFIGLAAVLLLAACAPAQSTPENVRVSVEVDSKQIALQLPAGTTVQNALQQAGITLNTLDRVEPPSYTILANDDTIKVTRVREVFSVKEVTIPFEHKTIRNESLPDGQELLVQPGVNGVEQVTYRQVFEDEKEISNSVFKEETISEPMAEVWMVGVQKPFTPSPIPGKIAYLAAGNAWLMENTTGNRRPVVATGDLDGQIFALSPKGDWLLFSRVEKANIEQGAESQTAQRINSLWAVDLTEENSKPVNLKVYNVIHFAGWVPGKGLTIAFSTVDPGETVNGWEANNDLQMLTFSPTGATGKQETILETNMGGLYGWWGTSFTWSPDGTQLAYARPDEIGLVDLETKSQVPLATLVPFQTGSNWAWVPGMNWSADQRVLYLVTHAPKAGLEKQEDSPLFDVSGLPLGEDPMTENGPLISIVPQAGMFAYPVPGPLAEDGSYQVAYLRAIFPEQSDTKRYRLSIIDRDGSNSREIFPAEGNAGLDPQQVVWSQKPFRNGSLWLAVNYQDNLWLVDSESGEAQQITGDGLVSRIDWK